MSARMTREIVHFHHPFPLPDMVEPLPAGRYEVEYEEERMDGLSFTAWRTVRTTLRRIEVTNGLSFALDVGAEALRVAIAADATQTFSPAVSPPASVTTDTPPVAVTVVRASGWRDLIIPPIVIPAAIGVAAIAAFILGPFQ